MVDEGNKVMVKMTIKREKFVPSVLGKRKPYLEKSRSCAMPVRRRDVASTRTYSLAWGKSSVNVQTLCKGMATGYDWLGGLAQIS